GAEAVQAESLSVAGQAECPVADQSRAEERRRLQVGIALGDRSAEALVGRDQLGVAAVPVIAREARVVAEVLAAGAAMAAGACRPPQPGHADPVALGEAFAPRDHAADRLLPRHE